MHQSRTISPQRSDLEIGRVAIVLAWVLLTVALTACGGGDDHDVVEVTEQEETLATTQTVPTTVLAKASEINVLLGPEAHCDRWFWDGEDSAWECTILGLSRTAELDITPEAKFSELEFAVSFVEIQRFAPDIAEMIESICGSSEQTVAEVSLRRMNLISAEPDLEELWTEPDLFIEVQCPGGEDFEIDPFGSLITASDDDVDPERSAGRPRKATRTGD